VRSGAGRRPRKKPRQRFRQEQSPQEGSPALKAKRRGRAPAACPLRRRARRPPAEQALPGTPAVPREARATFKKRRREVLPANRQRVARLKRACRAGSVAPARHSSAQAAARSRRGRFEQVQCAGKRRFNRALLFIAPPARGGKALPIQNGSVAITKNSFLPLPTKEGQ